jgi:hypothetical protein
MSQPMCGRKLRYRDEIAAKMALATIAAQDKSHRDKTEQRAYRCSRCRGWHLTSMTKETP